MTTAWLLLRSQVVACAYGVLLLAAGCGGGGSPAPADNPTPAAPAPPPVGQIGAAAWLQPSATTERDVFSTSLQAPVTASLTLQAPGVKYWFRYSYDPTLSDVSHTFRTVDDGIDFSISFKVFPERAPGNYTDTLSVSICYDEACARPAPGSPYALPLRMNVGYYAQAEPGVALLVPLRTTVLNHDVVDSAYSQALDAVITASARPTPLLRVHDLRSGLTRSIALLTEPTSLSLGTDGLQAAVGHDAAVSLVNLREGAVQPVRRLNVPMAVGTVVLAGTRVVAVGAQTFNWNDVYWVDTTTEVVTKAGPPGFAWVYGRPDAVLHPAGDRVYFANRGLSPDDVARMDMASDPAAARVVDSRYHGEYPFCGRVAASPDGRRLYTGCGIVLSTAPLLDDDMLYAGRMALSTTPSFGGPYVAAAVSVSPDSASIALLEEDRYYCNALSSNFTECHTRVAVFDATTLTRRSFAGLSPYVRGSDRLKQWGRRLMHRADGSLIVIAEVRTRNETAPTWLLHSVSP
jgi:hypothetical protein